MSILANYHLHLDLELEEDVIIEGENYLKSTFKESAGIIFDQDVDIHIEYKPGSIHYFIVVMGALFTAASSYGAIRSAVDYSIKDSKNLLKVIQTKLLKNGLNEDQLIEFTRLKGANDRTRLLFLHLDRFKKGLSNYSYQEMSNEIRLIGKKLDNLAYELDKEDFKVIVNQIRTLNIPQLNELYRDISKDSLFGKKEELYFPFK